MICIDCRRGTAIEGMTMCPDCKAAVDLNVRQTRQAIEAQNRDRQKSGKQ